METSKRETKTPYIICAIILLWIVASTIEVWAHNADLCDIHNANLYVLISAHHTDMEVVDCEGVPSDDYEVTVRDIKGNLYAYIDTEPREIGSVIRITMSGTDIINAK
jgi:hypothetical protein